MLSVNQGDKTAMNGHLSILFPSFKYYKAQDQLYNVGLLFFIDELTFYHGISFHYL